MAADDLTKRIIGACVTVHRALGPGLLESAYEACLAAELHHLGMQFQRQMPVPILYRDVALECGYRLDLVIEKRVVVELKSVERLEPIHQAQLLSYLRLTRIPVGLLVNFNVLRLVDGVKRLVHEYKP